MNFDEPPGSVCAFERDRFECTVFGASRETRWRGRRECMDKVGSIAGITCIVLCCGQRGLDRSNNNDNDKHQVKWCLWLRTPKAEYVLLLRQ